MILTIDTFAWVEIFRGTRLGRKARESIESAELCLTPSVVVAELARIADRQGLADDSIEGELVAVQEASSVVPIDFGIAIGAAHAVGELQAAATASGLPPPGLGDGLVLATARRAGGRLLTGDRHFQGCRETLWVG